MQQTQSSNYKVVSVVIVLPFWHVIFASYETINKKV